MHISIIDKSGEEFLFRNNLIKNNISIFTKKRHKSKQILF